ncbi:hypothetical protein FJZ26_02385 [Candidatus Parvarchaeota archaeon]|nr:hypothetical protein [Candidatus Parvarchaeota archaeon]
MALPESKLIRQEQIIRDMQLTSEVKMTKKSLVRYVALSLGLILPGESRTLMLDILEALMFAHFEEQPPDIHQLLARIAKIQSIEVEKVNPKAVRYHTLELKKRGIIERKEHKYCFTMPPLADEPDLGAALEHVYLENCKTSFEKIKKAIGTLESMR